ncbi:hypothetical protein SAMN02746041_01574 [Desulfacinum hydrothermale DSM 13146]|uniref:Aminoglycoside phosphotransferase domain-containing protein n=1 Tax=Desulfacinum hydrothermale DSM 13146 TaxID=1121390 RepID=A0A1W1XFU1_9BACT|nr:AAA family ATPase [Desulfacinum hydrothermale]SMC22856.1 hypothetical protein SAMN02746041_01574 [Desulfacinum hydrothermale DSM 13146]
MRRDRDTWDEVCAAFLNPTFYPHAVTEIRRMDTHISTVFLTGEKVYKLKKPVDLGFLDYSRLEDRHRFCHEEVRLNQRLSTGVYLGVAAVRRDSNGRLSLDGPGQEVEYAVCMRQLDPSHSLEARLKAGTLVPAAMEALGRRLAAFYASAQRSREIDRFGMPEAITYNVQENFAQTERFAGTWLDRERWEFIGTVADHFLNRHSGLFMNRIAQGRIRDGHGDLRPDHIYFAESLQIIDCIEFNDRFRYGDTAVDLAFLHMDLDLAGAAQWSHRALSAYVEAARDPGLYRLLDFYACYRAMVRVKVCCLRADQLPKGDRKPLIQSARRYLQQAYRHAVHFATPTLWICCGLPASGKSRLARSLASLLEIDAIHSDQIRRELMDRPEQAPSVTSFGKGMYRPERKKQVYAQLLARAHDRLRSGRSVIVDATFSQGRWRREALRLADDLDGSIVFLECGCPTAVLEERLRARETKPTDSDARLHHLPGFLETYEPTDDLPEDVLCRIDTQAPHHETVLKAMNAAYPLLSKQSRRRASQADG